jgi:hypothetical protein
VTRDCPTIGGQEMPVSIHDNMQGAPDMDGRARQPKTVMSVQFAVPAREGRPKLSPS